MKTLLITFISLFSFSSQAEQVLKSSQSESKFSLFPSVTYTQLNISTNNESLSGPGLELLLQYALEEKSALGFSYRQMNLGSESSGSALNFRYIYAITGALVSKSSQVNLDSKTILNNVDVEKPTWAVQAIGSQYYINTSSSTVPFTGFGLGTYYKYPFQGYSSLFAGLNYETMENNGTLTSLSFYFGMIFKI